MYRYIYILALIKMMMSWWWWWWYDAQHFYHYYYYSHHNRWNSFVITFRRPIVSSLLLSPNRRDSSWVSRSGRNRGSPRWARRWWNTALPSFLWRVSVPLSAAFPRTRPRFSPFVCLERSTLLSFAFRNYNDAEDETGEYLKKTSSEDNDGEEETPPAKSSSSSSFFFDARAAMIRATSPSVSTNLLCVISKEQKKKGISSSFSSSSSSSFPFFLCILIP